MESIRDVTFAALTTAALPWVASAPVIDVAEAKVSVSPTQISRSVSTWSGFISLPVCKLHTERSAWLDLELAFWAENSTEIESLMSEVSAELVEAMSSPLVIETEDDALAWATALVQSANR